MSSYHSKFKYLNKDSINDFGWIIVHFDADEGEVDSYLSQEQVYTDSYKGTKRLLYGTRWDTVANIKITVMKQNGTDFSVSECRNAYRWLTGNPKANWLDLCVGDEIKYSFLGTVQDVKPQKMDARTVALNIYFESVSPWAYSPIQYASYSLKQSLSIDDDGVVYKTGDTTSLNIDENGVLYNNSLFGVDNGTAYIDDSSVLKIDNQTDDLYTPIYLNTTIKNGTSSSVSIKNITLDEETVITNIRANEVITLTSEQFIMSDDTGRIFGNDFNFIWPRLAPGINNFLVSGNGNGIVEFAYRHCIKIGDCAVDVDALNSVGCGSYSDDSTSGDNTSSDGDTSSGGNVISGNVSWDNITNKPTTLSGYGIANAYTKTEIDSKIEDIECTCDGTEGANVDEQELNNMLEEVLGE